MKSGNHNCEVYGAKSCRMRILRDEEPKADAFYLSEKPLLIEEVFLWHRFFL